MPDTSQEPDIPFEARAFQAGILGLKRFWSGPLYARVTEAAARLGSQDPGDIESRLAGDAAYQFFGWLEHYLQQFKYLGHWGLVTVLERQEPELSRMLDEFAEIEAQRLQLDPGLTLPGYYCVGDFHQHPGGVWSDAHDAFVYEWGAATTTPLMAAHADLHTRYARFVKRLCDPKSVLDEGCGFGKTTLALKREMPEAEISGCDVSAPCLKLAHMRALQGRLPVSFVQCAVEALNYGDDSFDAVTGSMLLHEMPPNAIRESFREARRVLRPGGTYAHLDFYAVPGGVVGRFLHNGHSARNREPYMMSLCKMDLPRELEEAGFTDIRIEPFEEGEGALVNGDGLPPRWRFPWTVIVARAAG